MQMLKNKHVITAFIVTPVLAIGSWFAVDLIVKEKPQLAVVGQSYPLSAKSNCRYTSGECDLVNADFKSQLTVIESGGEQTLQLSSSHSLEAAKVGFLDTNSDGDLDEVLPKDMQAVNDDMTTWTIDLPVSASIETQLVLALVSQGTNYYAQTTMGFSEYETIFKKDYRSE